MVDKYHYRISINSFDFQPSKLKTLWDNKWISWWGSNRDSWKSECSWGCCKSSSPREFEKIKKILWNWVHSKWSKDFYKERFQNSLWLANSYGWECPLVSTNLKTSCSKLFWIAMRKNCLFSLKCVISDPEFASNLYIPGN